MRLLGSLEFMERVRILEARLILEVVGGWSYARFVSRTIEPRVALCALSMCSVSESAAKT